MLKWGNGPLQENLTVLKRLENLLGEKNLVLAQCNHHRPEQAEKPWVMMGIKIKKLIFGQLNNQFVEISQTLEMLFPPNNQVGIGIKYNFGKKW